MRWGRCCLGKCNQHVPATRPALCPVKPQHGNSLMQKRHMRSTAPNVSYVTLPRMSAPGITILDFLDVRFPCVGRKVWLARLEDGRISDDSGAVITLATPYRVNMRLLYRRE